MKSTRKYDKDDLSLPTDYTGLLVAIKKQVHHAQTRAVLEVNAELIRLYWSIGALIDTRQHKEGWGTGVIPRLARDLHNELLEEKGVSVRNIKRMLAFYREYPRLKFVPQAAAQIESDAKAQPSVVAQIKTTTKVQQPVAQIKIGPKVQPSSVAQIETTAKMPRPVALFETSEKIQQLATLFPEDLMLAFPWSYHGILMAMDKPIGVSSFELTNALPENLQSSLPSIEQIEQELRRRHQ